MTVNKVLYISQEISPYLPETPFSVFNRDLPQALSESGIEVRTFMPRYGAINERRNQLHEVIRLSGLNIEINDTDHPLIIKVATLLPSRMQVYFIDNDDFFARHATELETDTHAAENDRRSIFFIRGVLETAKKLRWIPSVIHCSGWISVLAPLYLRHVYAGDPAFSDTKVVFTLYDRELPAEFGSEFIDMLTNDGIPREALKAIDGGKIDLQALNRLAIDHADAIAVSDKNIDAATLEYARQSGKPLLEYPEDKSYAEAYGEFYRAL